MSPCQFFIHGALNKVFVDATALASVTAFVFGGTLVLPAAAMTFVGTASGIRLVTSLSGMEIAADHALLRRTRLLVSERTRPVTRSPFFSSRETVCATACAATRNAATTNHSIRLP